MGQAFDEDGNVLGEAFGDTKREVFDKLMAEHGDKAHELRVRKLYETVAEIEKAEIVRRIDSRLGPGWCKQLADRLCEQDEPSITAKRDPLVPRCPSLTGE